MADMLLPIQEVSLTVFAFLASTDVGDIKPHSSFVDCNNALLKSINETSSWESCSCLSGTWWSDGPRGHCSVKTFAANPLAPQIQCLHHLPMVRPPLLCSLSFFVTHGCICPTWSRSTLFAVSLS